LEFSEAILAGLATIDPDEEEKALDPLAMRSHCFGVTSGAVWTRVFCTLSFQENRTQYYLAAFAALDFFFEP